MPQQTLIVDEVVHVADNLINAGRASNPLGGHSGAL